MIIYRTTNKINGKIYVGQTVTEDKCYLGSGNLIKLAIKKYGKENFVRETLQTCRTQKRLDERERYWIKKLRSQEKEIGYNLENGGNGTGKHTEEWKRNVSEKMSGDKNHFTGKTHTEETKKHLSKVRKGKHTGKDNGFYGKTHSKESLKKIGESSKYRGKYLYDVIIGGKKIIVKNLKDFCESKGIERWVIADKLYNIGKKYNKNKWLTIDNWKIKRRLK